MAQLTNSQFSPEDLLFCKQSLAKVSRTFALNIRVLEGNLFKSVRLCYLLALPATNVRVRLFCPIMSKTVFMVPFNDLLRKDFEQKLELFENLSPIR